MRMSFSAAASKPRSTEAAGAAELETARKLAEEQKRRAELSEQREKDQKEATRKLRNRAWVITGLAVITVILGWIAWQGANQRAITAEQRARIAEERDRLATLKITKERQSISPIRVLVTPPFRL
jgi:uncharacterized membrane protein